MTVILRSRSRSPKRSPARKPDREQSPHRDDQDGDDGGKNPTKGDGKGDGKGGKGIPGVIVPGALLAGADFTKACDTIREYFLSGNRLSKEGLVTCFAAINSEGLILVRRLKRRLNLEERRNNDLSTDPGRTGNGYRKRSRRKGAL